MILLENLHYVLEKTPRDVIREDMLPMLYQSFDSPNIQILVIRDFTICDRVSAMHNSFVQHFFPERGICGSDERDRVSSGGRNPARNSFAKVDIRFREHRDRCQSSHECTPADPGCLGHSANHRRSLSITVGGEATRTRSRNSSRP